MSEHMPPRRELALGGIEDLRAALRFSGSVQEDEGHYYVDNAVKGFSISKENLLLKYGITNPRSWEELEKAKLRSGDLFKIQWLQYCESRGLNSEQVIKLKSEDVVLANLLDKALSTISGHCYFQDKDRIFQAPVTEAAHHITVYSTDRSYLVVLAKSRFIKLFNFEDPNLANQMQLNEAKEFVATNILEHQAYMRSNPSSTNNSEEHQTLLELKGQLFMVDYFLHLLQFPNCRIHPSPKSQNSVYNALVKSHKRRPHLKHSLSSLNDSQHNHESLSDYERDTKTFI
ncbi:hypothetical protein T439DRAFT_351144 [Meredithblackwellia eburnea MCA 4105]